VKKQFNDSMKEYIPEGVQGDFDHFLGPRGIRHQPDRHREGQRQSWRRHRQAVFCLPGLFFESRAKHPFVTEVKRLTPIDVHYPGMVEEQVTYYLPPGFTGGRARPRPTHLQTGPTNAVLTIRSTTTSADSDRSEPLAEPYNFTLLDYPGRNPELHDFYQKVATADQQQIVLYARDTCERKLIYALSYFAQFARRSHRDSRSSCRGLEAQPRQLV